MKIVIAPDKFKGSLPAAEVAAAIAAGLRAEWPEAELVTVPVADGGDGTVDAAVAAGLDRVPVVVEIILERVTNISMGTELDNVTEFEDLAARREDAPTAVAALLD